MHYIFEINRCRGYRGGAVYTQQKMYREYTYVFFKEMKNPHFYEHKPSLVNMPNIDVMLMLDISNSYFID